jgi:ubiquinone/menaquinone biosynthesis C-methylase UbiE
MGFYNNFILPRLCDLAMRNKHMLPYRQRVIGAAEGRVLEIGVGSGLNLPFYRNIREIIGLEPAPRLIAMARRAAESGSVPVTFIEGSAAAIPIEDRSIDTVVTTWTLCTIPDAAVALDEMRRVLTPGGRLLFVEHGRAPDAGVRAWQDWLTPAWKRISGGCHLNRPIRSMIEDAGFGFERLETGYMPGLRPMSFLYRGSARPAPPSSATDTAYKAVGRHLL